MVRQSASRSTVPSRGGASLHRTALTCVLATALAILPAGPALGLGPGHSEDLTRAADLVGRLSALPSVVPAADIDELPGVPLPASPATGTLDAEGDDRDVYAVDLDIGERLQCSVEAPDDAEFWVLLLPPGTTDIETDPAVSGVFVIESPDSFSFTPWEPPDWWDPSADWPYSAGTHHLVVQAIRGSGEYTLHHERIPPGSGPVAEPVEGADRIRTAIECSKKAFPNGANTVIVATGYDWPDALSAAPLSGTVMAPILLVHPGYLDDPVREEIERLGATRAYVLGGPGAVSVGVGAALAGMGLTVTRLAGTDRYGTSAAIAREVFRRLELNGKTDYVPTIGCVVTGADYPDALAVGPLASAGLWPILLEPAAAGLSRGTSGLIDELGLAEALIVGGPGVVDERTEAELMAALGAGSVARIAGPDRFWTAAFVAELGVIAGLSPDTVAVASGRDFPDALAGASLQRSSTSVLLLTDPTAVSDGVAAWMGAWGDGVFTVRFIGGLGAVSEAVRSRALQLLR